MVFAFAGDSTITRFFDMFILRSKRSNISIFLKNQILDNLRDAADVPF